ncbi:MAG: hypothetical protein WDN26_02670 [Chitinophagaceae bacterium]
MLNSGQEDEECDATEVDSSNGAGYRIILNKFQQKICFAGIYLLFLRVLAVLFLRHGT